MKDIIKSHNAFAGLYSKNSKVSELKKTLTHIHPQRVTVGGSMSSHLSMIAYSAASGVDGVHLFVMNDREEAAYFLNDLENLARAFDNDNLKENILFFPISYRNPYQDDETNSTAVLQRAEVLNRLNSNPRCLFIVTYPEAISEKVVTKKELVKNTFHIQSEEMLSLDFAIDMLIEYGFVREEFIYEPGQFSVRGGILDIFSYANDNPYRVEFVGDMVETIRLFDVVTQRSISNVDKLAVIPNIRDKHILETRESFLNYITGNRVLWVKDLDFSIERVDLEFQKAVKAFDKSRAENPSSPIIHLKPEELFIEKEHILTGIDNYHVVEIKSSVLKGQVIEFDVTTQPSFNKNFNLICDNLVEYKNKGYQTVVCSDNSNQLDRIHTILNDLTAKQDEQASEEFKLFKPLFFSLHEGFVDHDLKLVCYTDHQLFERYHRFKLKEGYALKEALTLKELMGLNPGDFVTHIDHGVGRFAGLEKIEVNGKIQETIRLVYRDNDLLYVSIHSLHRISKYSGKEGTAPSLNRLGSNAWNKLKEKTKSKVKELAIDLIKLYAERKSREGFAYAPDNYLQHELEASFIYEDTPDQLKSTLDVKKDMERSFPMDRLICGDVGFGKTEIAIRAAFKAVCDSKQVAILVPTTILALQHFKTFKSRLADLPCKVDYLNRFKTVKQVRQTLADLKEGKVDIIIGTHRLLSKDIVFKDLGLLIIDEEQKFGVATKEKIRSLKVDIDTLTLTATPIPRTLQFSLLGARDLSIINTPPPNRHPIKTEVCVFNEEIVREAIMYEIERGGQVFFIHNRVQNIEEVCSMIKKLCPHVRIVVGHGQMDGDKLEQVMVDFIDGQFDVLVATTIIESGLDISNANTIIINNAQNFGLSDLHQMRGRVGRSNKKAFCYLLAPPLSAVSDESRKRLQAIEQFSDLGSGFNIAMRDLDIRGAGNLLGGEQSGFINEMGYETYLKILNEAIVELKDSEFKELYESDAHPENFVADCQIDSDLEIMIPDKYVSDTTERISLYKTLDGILTDEGLDDFREQMIDRFGPMPIQVQELILSVKLRRMSTAMGFEKIVLKNGRFVGYFVSNPESAYYQSDVFTNVLEFIRHNPPGCKMQELKGKLTLTFADTNTVISAIERLEKMTVKE